MTTTESTNANVWATLGWELRSWSIPTHTETLVLNADRISDVAQGPGETTDDEPLFGAHLREALQAVRRLVR